MEQLRDSFRSTRSHEGRLGAQGTARAAFVVLIVTACVLAALALTSLSICQYRFGVNDQAQYLVQVIAADEPGVFSDDLYLDAFGSLGSVFWNMLGAVTTQANRPIVFLALTLGIAATNAAVLMLIARSLLPVSATRNRWFTLALAAPAILLCVPKELNWFGLVTIADVELTATLAVMPMVFASMLFVVRGRLWWALVFAIAAAPVQGQTAAYLLSAWWIAAVWTKRSDRRWLAALAGIGLLGALGLFKVWFSARIPPADSQHYFEIGRALYPELINPLNAPLQAWIGVVGLMGVGAFAAFRVRQFDQTGVIGTTSEHGSPSGSHRQAWRRFSVWWAASFVFPLAGVILHAVGIEDPLLWKFMTGRAFMLPQLAAVIAIALWSVRAMSLGTHLHWFAGAITLVTLSLTPIEQTPVMLAFALAGVSAACVVFTPLRQQARRAVGLPIKWNRAAAGSSIALAAVLGLGIVRFIERPYPWLTSGEETAWLEVQHWARSQSDPGSRFITPPYLSGWRVGSHRSSFGELKDGALLFYSGEPVFVWDERMRALGFGVDAGSCRWIESAGPSAPSSGNATPWLAEARERYARALRTLALNPEAALAGEFAVADFVIAEAHADPGEVGLIGPVAWSNERFVVRKVRSPAP